jgi:hypothetical protein
MIFKDLAKRFDERMEQEYGKGSTRDGRDGIRGEEPYLEFKPTTPSRTETTHDSYISPVGSIKRDLTRMSRFLRSWRGVTFLGRQQVLQAGNTFSETRILNPVFVIGNVQPFFHLRRPLTFASELALSGDPNVASPGSDERIRSAGRLQKATKSAVISSVMGGNKGLLSLLSIIPPNKITNTINTVLQIRDIGVLGINQRPELDVSGEYYSILMWKGFVKQRSIKDNLSSAAANLRVGNLSGALNSLKRTVTSVVNVIRSGLNGGKPPKPDGRDSINTGIEGRRYFITDSKNADRYLKNSITYGTNVDGRETPEVNTPFLIHVPSVIYESDTVAIPAPNLNYLALNFANTPFSQTVVKTSGGVSGLIQSVNKKINNFTQDVNRTVDAATKALKSPTQTLFGLNSSKTDFISFLTDQAKAMMKVPVNSKENPAENAMLFPETSLRQRYDTDDRVALIRDTLIPAQQASYKKYWALDRNKPRLGFEGGFKPGDDTSNIQSITTKKRTTGGYLKDRMNSQGVWKNAGGDNVSDSTIRQLTADIGQDLVNIFFFDFVNKNMIPFRAFISNIAENVTPDVTDRRYIGRIERNIVYNGVMRDLSFQLQVFAFSEGEMGKIWQKINYLTGLCYPSTYATGFMVPPLVKLTIGDYYRDQPGYIRSLSYSIDENISWEITPGSQIPKGMMVNVTYSVLEKKQMQTNDTFYPFGETRSAEKLAPPSQTFSKTTPIPKVNSRIIRD